MPQPPPERPPVHRRQSTAAGSCEALASQNVCGAPRRAGFVHPWCGGLCDGSASHLPGWACLAHPVAVVGSCEALSSQNVRGSLVRRFVRDRVWGPVRRQCVAPTGECAWCVRCVGARAPLCEGGASHLPGCSEQGARTAYFEGSERVWLPRFRLTPAHPVEFGGTVIATVRSFYEHYRVPADLLRGRP